MSEHFKRLEPAYLPEDFHLQSTLRGGRNYRRFTASEEPAGDNGEMLTHVSMSLGLDSMYGSPPIGVPDPAAATEALRLLFPQLQFESEGSHAMCLHFWEVKRGGRA